MTFIIIIRNAAFPIHMMQIIVFALKEYGTSKSTKFGWITHLVRKIMHIIGNTKVDHVSEIILVVSLGLK